MGLLEDLWQRLSPETRDTVSDGLDELLREMLDGAVHEVRRRGGKKGRKKKRVAARAARAEHAPRPPRVTQLERDLALLKVSATATVDEIKAAYRRRAFDVHPDRGGTDEQFIELSAAYQRLLRRAGGANAHAQRR